MRNGILGQHRACHKHAWRLHRRKLDPHPAQNPLRRVPQLLREVSPFRQLATPSELRGRVEVRSAVRQRLCARNGRSGAEQGPKGTSRGRGEREVRDRSVEWAEHGPDRLGVCVHTL